MSGFQGGFLKCLNMSTIGSSNHTKGSAKPKDILKSLAKPWFEGEKAENVDKHPEAV